MPNGKSVAAIEAIHYSPGASKISADYDDEPELVHFSTRSTSKVVDR